MILSLLRLIIASPDVVRYINGICSASIPSALFAISTALLTVVSFILIIVQIVMAIITFVHIKKHTLEGNVQIKKAVAKAFLYFLIESIINFVDSIISAV